MHDRTHTTSHSSTEPRIHQCAGEVQPYGTVRNALHLVNMPLVKAEQTAARTART